MGCGLKKPPGEEQVVNECTDAAEQFDTNGRADPYAPDTPAPKSTEDIRDKYIIGRKLGSGSFGQVREATVRNSPAVPVRAVKIIEYDGEEGEWSNLAMFKTEVGLLQNIDNANIIKYYDFYEDPSFLYVVMEKCDGGEVFQKIRELRRFGENDAAAIGRQMLSALAYIHRLHIVHRDIKAENFLFLNVDMSSPLKMIDFGMASTVMPGEYLDALCGSPHYLSPELIGQKYNEITDIWAFGVLMYLMLFGRYPHEGKRPEDIMWKVLTEKISWTSEKVRISQAAIFFLGRVLEPNWRWRYTAEKALQDTWISENFSTEKKTKSYLPTEIREAAHSASKIRFIAPKLNHAMDKKLDKINVEYTKGVKLGTRLGLIEEGQSDFSEKPEFVRHVTKKASAPAGHINNGVFTLKKKTSLKQASVVPILEEENSTTPYQMPEEVRAPTIQDVTEIQQTRPVMEIQQTRPAINQNAPGKDRFLIRASSTPAHNLSYMGNLNVSDATSFAETYQKLYCGSKDEKKDASPPT